MGIRFRKTSNRPRVPFFMPFSRFRAAAVMKDGQSFLIKGLAFLLAVCLLPVFASCGPEEAGSPEAGQSGPTWQSGQEGPDDQEGPGGKSGEDQARKKAEAEAEAKARAAQAGRELKDYQDLVRALQAKTKKRLTGIQTYRPTPDSYSHLLPVDQRGKVEKVTYTTTYQGKEYRKAAEVYLPAGYEGRPWMKYNVMYIMHGYSGGFTAYLGKTGTGSTAGIKLLLDHMIADKSLAPAIFVFPEYYPDRSFYGESYLPDGPLVKRFAQHELFHDLVPAVEGHYRTYTTRFDKAGYRASRLHRAFGGFSMGSAATWYSFQYDLDKMAYFLPVAQSSWALHPHGGLTDPAGTASVLSSAVSGQGLTAKDFLIAGGAGTQDVTYLYMRYHVTEMRKHPAVFTPANLEFGPAMGMGHTRAALINILHQNLPFMFLNTQV